MIDDSGKILAELLTSQEQFTLRRTIVLWKPINVLATLGQWKSEKINRNFLLLQSSNYLTEGQSDHINQMITLSVITLSTFHVAT